MYPKTGFSTIHDTRSNRQKTFLVLVSFMELNWNGQIFVKQINEKIAWL